MPIDYKSQIDAIQSRVASLERDHLKAEMAVTFITEKVDALKTLLKEKYSVETIEAAKAKLAQLQLDLQKEIDAINKVL